MINLTELSVGSWIRHGDQYIMLDVTDLVQISTNVELYYPIELTDDILQACDFQYIELWDWWREPYTQFTIEKTLSNTELTGYRHFRYEIEVKTLHELQSLFRLLTERPLIFNPRKLERL